MFRNIRIAVLLLLLLFLGLGTFIERFYMTRWNAPIVVALYPINADGSEVSENFLAKLQASDFASLESFFQTEAGEYKVPLDRPIRITLAPLLSAIPPKPPRNSNVLAIMAWSLHLRWWAWRTPPAPPGPTPRINLFLLFHDPAKHPSLEHSTGLEKGKVGIVNLFAAREEAGSNLVITAHELLHTLGATDKYNLADTQPRFPEGFGEPELTPRYPQRFAELMGGRIPISPSESKIPDSLKQVIVGPKTAAEIGWVK
jgi:hypothetical protein